MPTRNVQLTEQLNRFVEKQVRAGRYQSASEVLQAGLHLLEQQTRENQEKLTLLRALAAEGFEQLDQGQGLELNGPRQLARHIGKIGRRAAASVKRRRRGG